MSKVAFITGSAKRIGATTAKHLHEGGFNIVLHYQHSIQEAQQLCDVFNLARANSAKVIQGDICNISGLGDLAQHAIGAFGRLDVLVNNASSFYPNPFGDITHEDWRALVGSNMQGPLFLAQHCMDALKEQQGCIINMADIHAMRPLYGHTLYCMAKAALVSMTKSLAQELAPEVRVNGVAPGAILWPEQALSDSEKEDILQQVPAGKLGSADDIAEAIVYLVKARYVTGQILAVDGGRSIASTSKA